jgi:signal transduction histidine kinase
VHLSSKTNEKQSGKNLLYQFLEENRAEILALSEEKTVKLAGLLPSSSELKRGLPVFYEHLIQYLKSPKNGPSDDKIVTGAANHGRELLRLNYSLSHVVHAYGAMCQAITELAQRRKADISTLEFNELNLCLDVAIASAVSEFQFHSVQASEEREIQHMGFLVHELRNALSSATIAHEMIKQGLVGAGGSTARVLEENLAHMRNLIDRSLSEIRMRADPHVFVDKFRLSTLVDQILLTAQSEARQKKQILSNETDPEIEMETDRQLLLSIVANLTRNGIKYTKVAGHISVRAKVSAENIVIEVDDECGGIDPAISKNLFKPFVSQGLGLTIVQRAVSLLQGKISVHNNPGKGCVFMIEIPKKLTPTLLSRSASGENSVQPGRNT